MSRDGSQLSTKVTIVQGKNKSIIGLLLTTKITAGSKKHEVGQCWNCWTPLLVVNFCGFFVGKNEQICSIFSPKRYFLFLTKTCCGGFLARMYLQLQLQQWGGGQCLPLCVVQLKGKHCRKPHYPNGVVDTFGDCQFLAGCWLLYHWQTRVQPNLGRFLPIWVPITWYIG